MIIKQISLKNFRQYKGQQDPIVFSTEKEKNVTVILGINTSGKTTLIQAFNWCLYGKVGFKDKSLLNIETANELSITSSAEVVVEIELIHENKLYVIRRKQIYRKVNYDKIISEEPQLKVQYKEDNGEMQEVSFLDSQDRINKILPNELSDYFFFDGEHIVDISNKKDVAAAIKGLMGLDIIADAVKHLNPNSASSVISKLRKELDVGKDSDNERLKIDIESAQNELDKIKESLNNYDKEIEFFSQRKIDLEEKIRANKGTKEKQIQKDKSFNNINYFENLINNYEKRLIEDFSKNACKYFALSLYKKAKDILSNAKESDEAIPDMNSRAIEYILKRKKCICGCDLTKNQGAVEAIRYEQSLLPPENIGTLIRNYKRDCQNNANEVENYCEKITDDYRQYRLACRKLSEEEENYKKLSEELQGNIDVGAYEKDNADNDSKLRNARSKKDEFLIKKGSTENFIDNKNKEFDKLASIVDKNKKIRVNIDYAIELYNWFNQSYTEKEKQVRVDLYESVNRIFKEMYHGERKLEIDDKYQIVLKSKVREGVYVTDTSPGLDTVKNFAFISGLVDLAKQRANNKGEDFEKVEPYPIVMDAPFSNADEIHIKNISRVIPFVAEQVILVVMKKDWDIAQDTMLDKTSIIYQIEKFSETNSSIRREV